MVQVLHKVITFLFQVRVQVACWGFMDQLFDAAHCIGRAFVDAYRQLQRVLECLSAVNHLVDHAQCMQTFSTDTLSEQK